jgi:DNA polymerase III sliding clamp (beta) subunit (PCNA family)
MKIEVMPEVFVVGKHSLKRLLDRVKDAVPSKAGRRSISAVKFESDGTRLRAVASDGFRIAIAEVPITGLMKFPSYEKAIARTDFKTELKFSAHSLRAALFQLKPALDRLNPKIAVEVVGSEVRISAGDAETVLVGAKISGENNKVALNPHFVSDFLSQVTDKPFSCGYRIALAEEVTMQIVDETTPVRLSNGPEYVHLVCPLLPEVPKAETQEKVPVSSEETSSLVDTVTSVQ